MIPRLFEIPWLHWPINSYGFMIMVGFLLATWVGVRRGKELGISSDLVLDVGIIGMIAGIVGGKINYVLQYPDPTGSTLILFDFTDGMSWLGGLVLGPLPFAFWYARTKADPKVKLYSWQNFILLLATLIFTFAGTRILHLVLNRAHYDWKAIWSSLQSGFVLYGGLLAGFAAGSLYAIMRGVSPRQIADIGAPGMMLGVAFGRIGCLLNGCCWGCPTTLPWGMRFPEGSDAAHQILKEQRHNNVPGLDPNAASPLPVHPTQVYETLATIAIFFVLSWWWRKKKKVDGEVMLLAGILYPAWRFMVEFIRGDERPLWLGPLSYSQTLSLVIGIGCGIALFVVRRRAAVPPEEKPGLASEAAKA